MERHERVRERIVWSPEWTDEYKKWTTSYMTANAWRVDNVNSVKDLVQEAWFVFDYVRRAYPRIIDADHFFRLYKRAIVNKVHDWSCRKRRRKAVEPVVTSLDVSEFFTGRIGEISNAGYLMALINEAPEEIRLTLNHLAKHGASEAPRRGLEPRENLSMKLCRAVGLPVNLDPMAELKRLLTSEA